MLDWVSLLLPLVAACGGWIVYRTYRRNIMEREAIRRRTDAVKAQAPNAAMSAGRLHDRIRGAVAPRPELKFPETPKSEKRD